MREGEKVGMWLQYFLDQLAPSFVKSNSHALPRMMEVFSESPYAYTDGNPEFMQNIIEDWQDELDRRQKKQLSRRMNTYLEEKVSDNPLLEMLAEYP